MMSNDTMKIEIISIASYLLVFMNTHGICAPLNAEKVILDNGKLRSKIAIIDWRINEWLCAYQKISHNK